MHSFYLFTIIKKTATRISKLAQNWHRFVWLPTLENLTVSNPWNYSLFYMHLLKNYCFDFNSEKTFKLPIALSTFDLNLVSRPNFINFVWLSIKLCMYGWCIFLHIFMDNFGPKKYFCDLTLIYVIYFRYLHDLLFKIEIEFKKRSKIEFFCEIFKKNYTTTFRKFIFNT